MTKVSAAKTSLAGGLADAVPLLEVIDTIDARVTAIHDELRTPAHRALPPKAEVTTLMLEWLGGSARRFVESKKPQDAPAFTAISRLANPTPHYGNEPSFANERELLQFFAWALWPQLQESVPIAVARLEYVEGLPSKERATLRESLERERQDLLVQRESTVDQVLTLSGGALDVKHHPETASRRISEARAREREAEARKQQAALLEEIDRRHAESTRYPRGGRSAYLESVSLARL